MKTSVKVLTVAALGTGIFLISGEGDTFAKEGEVAVQLQGINDLHGQIQGTGSLYEYGKKLKDKAGSAPLLASYLDESRDKFLEEKKEDAVTLRVQAGDMVGASQAESGILQDEPTMKSLKKMDFKVGTLGNHEFDEGLDEYNRVLTGAKPEAGKFNKAVDNYPRENTEMEFTIANVTNLSDGKIPYGWQPYVIKELTDKEGDTAKIGFIGVVTEEIPTLVLKKQWEKFNVSDPAEAINKYSKQLKEKGVNAIVVLAHAAATSRKDNDTEVQGEIRKIIDNLDPNSSVDVIFAGHNHVITNATYKGIRVVEGASHGKAFGNIEAIYDTKTNDFKEVKGEVVKVLDNKRLAPRPDIKAIADDAAERIKEIVNEKIANGTETVVRKIDFPADTPEYKKSAANLESPLGNLITNGQLAAARANGYPQADFAITNDGGIRADLEVKDGAITWGSAQKVQPFGNIMQIIEISGKDLIAALNSQYNSEETYFLQMSGIGYSYKEAPAGTVDSKGKPVKWVVDKAWIEKDGKKVAIDENKKYVGVINDFLFGGGDDFPEFTKSKLLGALDPDTEIFVSYLKDLKDVKSPELARKIYHKDLKDSVVTETSEPATPGDDSKLDKVLIKGSFDVYRPAKKLGVMDITKLSEKEKNTLKEMFAKINNDKITIDVDDKGNVTLVDFELGKEYNVLATDLVEQIETAIPGDEAPTVELPEVVIVEKETTKKDEKDNSVETSKTKEEKDSDAQTTKEKMTKANKKESKKLPNTGQTSTTSGLLGLGLIIGALALRRKFNK